MKSYYNEWEPFAAQWLRNLIGAGLLPAGDVDERSITEVKSSDLRGYDQCHFFCGIGGWPLALQLAGIPNDTKLWTGSAPCQPFSHAGREKGFDDERHLWPAFFNLIRECRPPVVFGEQVENAIRHGWLDLVFGDLESENYACGAAVLGAHSVGAPHKRQRLYWAGTLGDAHSVRRNERREAEGVEVQGESSQRAGTQLESRSEQARLVSGRPEGLGSSGSVGNPIGERLEGFGGLEQVYGSQGRQEAERHGSEASFWDNCDWVECRDGVTRPLEPGIEPLVDGFPGIMGRLRAYGNALVPQVAAEFIKAVMD